MDPEFIKSLEEPEPVRKRGRPSKTDSDDTGGEQPPRKIHKGDEPQSIDEIPLNTPDASRLVLTSLGTAVEKGLRAVRYPISGFAGEVYNDKNINRAFYKWWRSWIPDKISALSPGYAFGVLFAFKALGCYKPDDRRFILITEQVESEGYTPPTRDEIARFSDGRGSECPFINRVVADCEREGLYRTRGLDGPVDPARYPFLELSPIQGERQTNKKEEKGRGPARRDTRSARGNVSPGPVSDVSGDGETVKEEPTGGTSAGSAVVSQRPHDGGVDGASTETANPDRYGGTGSVDAVQENKNAATTTGIQPKGKGRKARNGPQVIQTVEHVSV